ncbi:cytochrome c oxidase subunit 1, partial [Cladochytrium tenue]
MQAIDTVLRDAIPLKPREAIQLAALKAQATMGDCNRTSAMTTMIASLKQRDQTVADIVQHYSQFRGMPSLQAKFLYLQILQTNHFYGAALFRAEYQGFWTFGQDVWIAVSCDGIEFAEADNREAFMVFTFEELAHHEAGADGRLELSFSRQSLQQPGEQLDNTEIYAFATPQALEVAALIVEYDPAKGRRGYRPQFADLDAGVCARDVEKQRAILLEKGVMRVPGPSATEAMLLSQEAKTTRGSLILKAKRRGSHGFSWMGGVGGISGIPGLESMASSRSSISRADKAPTEYGEADWTYSQSKLVTSLSVDEAAARLEEFGSYANTVIWRFAHADFRSKASHPVDFAPQIQDVLASCLAQGSQAGELYLQLVKLTTAHPNPAGQEFANLWKLMSIACGAVVPESQEIASYVRAHLRKCIAYSKKDSNDVAGRCAKYCLRTFMKTAASEKRRYPPSTEEIIFAS